MLVTEFGITVLMHPAISVFVIVSIIALQLSRESYFVFPDSTSIVARLEQFSNTLPFILATEFGIETLVRSEQPENAELPMLVTELGMVTLVKLQPRNAYSPMLVTKYSLLSYVTFSGITTEPEYSLTYES